MFFPYNKKVKNLTIIIKIDMEKQNNYTPFLASC